MHHIAEELKQRSHFLKIQNQNLIEFDNYFRYSGKEEKVTLVVAYLLEKKRREKAKFVSRGGIKNDMTKYKLKQNER